MIRKGLKYRAFIEDYFLIDRADTGQLVSLKFNKVQNKYYDDLCSEYDIENKGITASIRENIVKARREGFSSLILAIFAADDIMQENPTETTVISYKDEATKTFRRRYRTYVLSYFAQKAGYTKEQIAKNINVLEEVASACLETDSTDIVLAKNRAHFYCGTASAKVGGRGGVLHKLLFSEIAFYPDTEKIMAAEMIEATMRQVDISSGWVFAESTENGVGTYQHKMWTESKRGLSRFHNRFYGWPMFYTESEYEKIKSEYIDKDALRRDYPKDESDLFKGSAKAFTTEVDLMSLVGLKNRNKEIIFWLELQGVNYIDQAEIIQDNLNTLIKENPMRGLYAGIDVAKDRDATVLTVISDTRPDLTGGVKAIAIDSTGIGDYLPDWFTNNSRWHIIEVKFSRLSKDIMYKNLQVIIVDKLTMIPQIKVEDEGSVYVSDEHKHFFQQMIQLEKQTIGNLLVVSHPVDNQKHDSYEEGAHDDYPDSWALAEYAYISINGKPVRTKPPKPPTVQNAVENMLGRGMNGDRKKYGSTDYE